LAAKKLTHRQRVESCLAGGVLDRVPVALWRHFPVDDQSSRGLASATINFQNTYDFDFVKVTPASSFCVRDWGVKDEWRGAWEGTREYTHFVINQPEDWLKIKPLNPKKGILGQQLDCLKLIVQEVGLETPVIQTIFNPLCQAKYLISQEKMIFHLRTSPDAVKKGLSTIVESTIRFIEAAKETGISGIFFAVQHAQYGVLSELEYKQFGVPYDLVLLSSINDLWLNVLHLHGNDVMFDLFTDYPIQVLNWHDRDTAPDLATGKERFKGVVCGGLRRYSTMVLGSPQQVTQEAKDAINSTDGKRFILGTGCVTPTHAPYGNFIAARNCVEKIHI